MGARRLRALRAAGRLHASDRRRAGLLWYDDERFDSPLTLKVEWLVEGDSNSGVFMGFPPVGDDPFVAVERGYETRSTRPTSRPRRRARSTASRPLTGRDAALRPAGEWNAYELTVDAPRVVVRLNGVVVNRFRSTSAARQSLGHGVVGLQNHGDADRVRFRSVQVKEWAGERPRCFGAAQRTPSDTFSAARLDGCRWTRIELLARRSLPPGRWRLTVVLENLATGRTVAASRSVRVP